MQKKQQKYYRSRRSGHDTLDQKVRRYIRKRDNDTCQICKRKYNPQLSQYMPDKYFDKIHIDHITPIHRFGVNHVRNYQLTCSTCNLKKGAYIENEQ